MVIKLQDKAIFGIIFFFFLIMKVNGEKIGSRHHLYEAVGSFNSLYEAFEKSH